MTGQPKPVSSRRAPVRFASRNWTCWCHASTASTANSGSVCSHAKIASANPCAMKNCADSAAQAMAIAETRIAGPAHSTVEGCVSARGTTNRSNRKNEGAFREVNRPMVQRTYMPSFRVETPQRAYDAIVERGSLARVGEFLPPKSGKIFVVTTADVWELHGAKVVQTLAGRAHQVLFLPGGEPRKKMAEVEALAEQMMAGGGDRSSIVVAFGGGIVTDVAGFLAA